MFRLFLASMFLLASSQATAATIITSSLDAALSGATLIDLDGEPDGTDFVNTSVSGLTVLSNANTLRFDDDWASQFGTTGIALETRSGGAADDLELIFAAPVTAFGFDINALDIDLTMILFDAMDNVIDSFTIANQPGLGLSGFNRRGYAGASSVAPIARVQLVNATQHDWFLIDNIALVTAVPEAATSVLLATGLIGLALAGRERSGGVRREHSNG
ncbi:MAG: hypothetical protein GY723_11490 [bacterium]|nr:hypothetical protein [bacterium]MCP5069429.1 hypothetical protein [bacterium]